jgi:copper chaperone CopZ
MSLLKSGKIPKVFSIQVSGIKCTNCAGKIKKGLGEGLNDPEAKVAVNIIQEKVSLTVFKDSTVQKAIEILIQIGFPPIGEPVPISGGDDTQRVIAFLINNKESVKVLEDKLENTLGIQKLGISPREQKYKISVTYNCEIIKGKELAAIVAEVDGSYKVINDRIDSFATKEKVNTG